MIHNMGEYINEINLIYIFSEVIDSIMSQCVYECVLLFGKKKFAGFVMLGMEHVPVCSVDINCRTDLGSISLL